VTPDKRLRVREAGPKQASKLLTAVEEASREEGGVDNITLNMAMRRHARAEAKAGSPAKAAKVVDRMLAIFTAKGLNPQVLQTIDFQAEETKEAIAAETGERAARSTTKEA
jgi:hypothetical protein